MTSVAHGYHSARRGVLTTWTSHRLAGQLALVAATIILMVVGYLIATEFVTSVSPPLHIDPMSTAPGAGA